MVGVLPFMNTCAQRRMRRIRSSVVNEATDKKLHAKAFGCQGHVLHQPVLYN